MTGVTGAGVTLRENGLRYTVPDYCTAVHVDGEAPRSGQTVSGYGGKLAWFSSRECDGCGSTLAGDREEAAIVR